MDRTCTEAGCEKPVRARGLCNTHWRLWRLAGGVPNLKDAARGCSVDDCENKHYGHGWCRGHWEQYADRKRCRIETCTRVAASREFCSMHYRRLRRNGDPEALRRRGNRHDVGADGSGELTISCQDGQTVKVLYDLEDAERIQRRHWYVMANGYIASSIGPRGATDFVLMQRFVLNLERGDSRMGDHIDGDICNNRRSNLRAVTPGENVLNQAVVNHKGSSRYRGVSWSKKRKGWYAYQNYRGKMFPLGVHETEEAAAAAVAAFREHHGLPAGY